MKKLNLFKKLESWWTYSPWQKRAIWILILVFFIVILIIYFAWKPLLKTPETFEVKPQPTKAPKILTPEEIQEALSKKAEISSDIKPLAPEEIDKALEKKAPKKEKTSPLTPEEIQKALNSK